MAVGKDATTAVGVVDRELANGIRAAFAAAVQ